MICNDDWFQTYVDSTVLHLSKFSFDHRPILVRFDKDNKRHLGNKPFRFLAAWLTDSSFNDFVAGSWNNQAPFPQAVGHFVDEVSKWNKEHFGNVFHRKRRLLARLGGIQKALENFHSGGLILIENRLKRELNEVLTQEDLLWRQKSRQDRLLHGDRNTTYF